MLLLQRRKSAGMILQIFRPPMLRQTKNQGCQEHHTEGCIVVSIEIRQNLSGLSQPKFRLLIECLAASVLAGQLFRINNDRHIPSTQGPNTKHIVWVHFERSPVQSVIGIYHQLLFCMNWAPRPFLPGRLTVDDIGPRVAIERRPAAR